MSEYLNKKAVLEWLDERRYKSPWIESFRDRLESGAFNADESEGTWKATSEFAFRLNDQLESEIHRLRSVAIKLHETINSFWQGDCDKAAVVMAQSNLCDALSTATEPTDAAKVERFECPCCGCEINAKERVGTEEWRHKYFGAEWPKAEGDGNDA